MRAVEVVGWRKQDERWDIDTFIDAREGDREGDGSLSTYEKHGDRRPPSTGESSVLEDS
jgi:hypothetical protein